MRLQETRDVRKSAGAEGARDALCGLWRTISRRRQVGTLKMPGHGQVQVRRLRFSV